MTNAGGQGEGLDPAKTISFDPVGDLRDSPFITDTAGIEVRPGVERADNICADCVVATVLVPENGHAIDEVRVIGLGDRALCRIYLNNNQIVYDECGWHNEPIGN